MIIKNPLRLEDEVLKSPNIANDIFKNSAIEGNLSLLKKAHSLGADIHANEDFALRQNAENGNLEIVKYLVEQGADIHAYNAYALKWSSINGHLEVVKYLVERKVQIFMLMMNMLLDGVPKMVISKS